jgi:flagellar hook-associated protein 3 FlgL
MRIADKMRFDQVRDNIGKNRSTMQDLQNQAATQKRVTKPSDDPLAAARVLANRIDLQGNKQFGKDLNQARSFLEYTDQSLGDLSDILVRAKELAISQSNDASANEESRRVVATEVDQLYNQMVNIGNRKLGDRFIFGGYSTQVAPFDTEGNYHGDAGEMNIHIDKESFLPMNIPGGRVFLGMGVDSNGMAKQGPKQPLTIEELEMNELQGNVEVRGPASVDSRTQQLVSDLPQDQRGEGMNLFGLLRDLEISLKTNDKQGVQDTLNRLDEGLEQVVLTRSAVGSRATLLDNMVQTIEKAKVDNKAAISSLEDADVYSTVSDINKTESTLQATLQTSGKMIQPSLLDFLR